MIRGSWTSQKFHRPKRETVTRAALLEAQKVATPAVLSALNPFMPLVALLPGQPDGPALEDAVTDLRRYRQKHPR